MKNKKLFLFLLPNLFFIVLFIWDFIYPVQPEKSFSKIYYDRNGYFLGAYLSDDDQWRIETQLTDLPKNYLKFLLEKEDKYFFYHPGVDVSAIFRALISNIISQKKVSGASTITMQLVRLSEHRERNYLNKLIEICRAYQLELNYTKKEILYFYINNIPFGSNIEGPNAAALLYLDKPLKQLSSAEIASFLIIPNQPISYNIKKNNPKLIVKRNQLLKELFNKGYLTSLTYNQAILEPFSPSKKELPKLAPHYTLFLTSQFPNQYTFNTTIDKEIQIKTQTILKSTIEGLVNQGITNGAVIVVDNNTRSVLAYCGSADFSNVPYQGQVDAVKAYHSPGSALKPFLYAKAMDIGILTPKSILMDIPMSIEGFQPENFDEKFRGMVDAQYALINSLNIPAVQVLESTGLTNFKDFLANKLHFENINNNKRKLGYAIILGGCQVNLLEMVNAYSVFSHKGNYSNLIFYEGQPRIATTTVISPDAVFLLNTMLRNNTRPDMPIDALNKEMTSNIAWKTGTSFGKKDAWAMGYTPDYTIGVWLGNMNGKGANSLTGAVQAVPLLFNLFESLYQNKPMTDWAKPPTSIKKRQVCLFSGLPKGNLCTQIEEDIYSEKISNLKPCDKHFNALVDVQHQYSYCIHCQGNTKSLLKEETFNLYPPDYTAFALNQKKAIKLDRLCPPHNPNCDLVQSSGKLSITNPQPDFDYILDKESPQKMKFKVGADISINYLYWYMDGIFLGASGQDGIFWQQTKGLHTLKVLDDRGRTAEVKFRCGD